MNTSAIKVHVGLSIELEDKLELDKIADRYDASCSQVIRLAIKRFIENVKQTETKLKEL